MSKIKVITVATRETPELAALVASVHKVGMEIEVLGLGEEWKGFGTKVIMVRDYLRTLEGYTHFVFVDAFDTLFQRKLIVPSDVIFFSTEKHKWPDADAPYEKTIGNWPYLNSGVYSAPIDKFLAMIDEYPIDYADDDQRYFTNIYLSGGPIGLDCNCNQFQSYAFQKPGDFSVKGGKLHNNITGTTPAIIHFNGKCHDKKIYNMVRFDTLDELQRLWKDEPDTHRGIHETFCEKVNDTPRLKAHRDFVEQNIFGFGERSFQWMWNLIIQEMPDEFTFMEIGVFKGQTLSLCELLADMNGKQSIRYGVTPLSSEGGVWESDYRRDIARIHDTFEVPKDYVLLEGLSEDPAIIKAASGLKLDILYIDGGHEERHIRNDIVNYAHLVDRGGYLVIDDCCNSMRMPFGYFQGIEAVTRVVDELLPVTGTPEWEFIASVVHNRIYRRK